MTAHDLLVMRRPKRRTHLSTDAGLLCGTRLASVPRDAVFTSIPLIGGATARLRNDLFRELDHNACIPCTFIARGMLALYASRDTGKAW